MKCKTCLMQKRSEHFYPSRADVCKECVKAAVKENRRRNAEHYREYERKRANLPHRVSARRAYQKTLEGKAASARASKAWQERNVLKRAAHIITGNAIRDGKLTKMTCVECGAKKVEAHHEDYGRPLDVIWLCRKHHIAIHKNRLDRG